MAGALERGGDVHSILVETKKGGRWAGVFRGTMYRGYEYSDCVWGMFCVDQVYIGRRIYIFSPPPPPRFTCL
jgi:hypothetical protein